MSVARKGQFELLHGIGIAIAQVSASRERAQGAKRSRLDRALTHLTESRSCARDGLPVEAALALGRAVEELAS